MSAVFRLLFSLQLRVIRAFRSTLEDLEERRSVHSLHSLHSMRSSRSHTGPRPLSDFTFIDEDPANKMRNQQHQQLTTTGSAITTPNTSDNEVGRGVASPLLLHVPATGNHHHHHHHHHQYHQQQNNGKQQQQQQEDANNAVNSLRSSTSNLSELPKFVHETCI